MEDQANMGVLDEDRNGDAPTTDVSMVDANDHDGDSKSEVEEENQTVSAHPTKRGTACCPPSLGAGSYLLSLNAISWRGRVIKIPRTIRYGFCASDIDIVL